MAVSSIRAYEVTVAHLTGFTLRRNLESQGYYGARSGSLHGFLFPFCLSPLPFFIALYRFVITLRTSFVRSFVRSFLVVCACTQIKRDTGTSVYPTIGKEGAIIDRARLKLFPSPFSSLPRIAAYIRNECLSRFIAVLIHRNCQCELLGLNNCNSRQNNT